MILRDRGGEADKWKISASGNPLIALLIRRATRATFPDMGRLTDSFLPTTEVETTEQFCFYFFTAYCTVVMLLYCLTGYANLLNTLTY